MVAYLDKYNDLKKSALLEHFGGKTRAVVEGGSKREEGGRPGGGVSTSTAADALRHFGKLVKDYEE